MRLSRELHHASIHPHPQTRRLYEVTIDEVAVEAFFSRCSDVGSQHLSYVPYMRLILAAALQDILGPDFVATINAIVRDRATGGFTLSLEGRHDPEDFIKWATAFSHMIGLPNHDSMSNNYYALFSVMDTDNSDSYLRQAYRTFTLHTDGTFVDEPTDWLLMFKMGEVHAAGGRSRLLHLDDWEDLERFIAHPCARRKILYKSPPSKNVAQVVHRPTFFNHGGKPCICFIDQFAHPQNVQEASFLKDLSESMENSAHVLSLELPVGGLVLLNNLFWLHGREAFQKHPQLNRELMRQRGRFHPTLVSTGEVDHVPSEQRVAPDHALVDSPG